MFRTRKQRKTKSEDWGEEFSLTLAAENGAPFMSFSPEVVESLRYMLARLGRQDVIPERLALVSALRGEGVTYIARALGTVMANDLPVEVCVVELNFWWGAAVPHGAPFTKGLAGVLRGEIGLEESLVSTNRPNLKLLPARSLDLVHRPIYARSDRLRQVLDRLSEQFDYLLLDVPALQATSDAIHLASLGDAACLVVQQGVTPMDKVQQALDDISHMPLVGIVMNQTRLATPSWLFKYVPQS